MLKLKDQKKEWCANKPTIAYTDKLGGCEIKAIQYGIVDYVYFVSGTLSSEPKYNYRRLYNTASGRAFFIVNGRQIYLDECIRCN